MKPLVSIGILSYNQEEYISDAINSVLQQTYPNIEVIIFDDCSTDSTVKIIESRLSELKRRAHNIHVYYSPVNTGNISKNINHIVRTATGKYVHTVAADDLLLPGFVEETVTYLERFDEYGMVVTNGFIVDKDYRFGQKYDEDRLHYNGMPDFNSPNLYYNLMCQDLVFAPGTMIKKSVYEKIGMHDEQIKYEDYEFWIRCAKNNIRIAAIDDPLVIYRRAESSVTFFKKNSFEKIRNWIESETAVKEKYLKDFNRKEQILIITRQCSYPAKQCDEYGYLEGFELLERFSEKYGVCLNLRSDNRNRKGYTSLYGYNHDDDITRELRTFCSNNSIKSVALYGYGTYGKRLYQLLENADIQIGYVVDRNPNIKTSCEHITPKDRFREVDAVFITSSYDVELIIETVQSKVKCKVFSMDDIEYEMYCNYIAESI